MRVEPIRLPEGWEGCEGSSVPRRSLAAAIIHVDVAGGRLGQPQLGHGPKQASKLMTLVARRKTVRRANNLTGQGQADPPSDDLDDALAEQVKFEEMLANEKDASAQQQKEQVSERL